jgi:2-polyprenyl-6-methoxyphenol hydroxylase-like FAD-dependent oxidoreductase
VDRETTPRDRSWAITISWGHAQLERLLPFELFASLQSCQPDQSLDVKTSKNQCALVRDGATGEVLCASPYPGVRRLQIQKTKRNWARDLDVQYGKKLTDIEILSCENGLDERVLAKFEDGTTQAATVIVGADGGVSNVRRWLLGDDLAAQEELPLAFMNFPFTLPADKAVWLDNEMNPNVDVATHPKSMYMGIFLLDKPDLQRPETWIFYILTTWPLQSKEDDENHENRLERLRRRMDGWSDPYKSVLEWISDDVVIKKDQLRIWHPKPWNKEGQGCVTLAGDAAHSMTFHRGQGGNLAIQDAEEFMQRMIAVRDGKASLQEAIDDYDKGVLERGQEVAVSKTQTMAFHDYENFLNSPVVKMGIQARAK